MKGRYKVDYDSGYNKNILEINLNIENYSCFGFGPYQSYIWNILTQSTVIWEIFTNLYEKWIDKLENKPRAKNYLIILIVFSLGFIISLGSLFWQKTWSTYA